MPQFNIRDLPSQSENKLEQLVEWTGRTKVQIMLTGLDKLWKEIKQEKEEEEVKRQGFDNYAKTFYHLHVDCSAMDKADFKTAVSLCSYGSIVCHYIENKDELLARFENKQRAQKAHTDIWSTIRRTPCTITEDTKCISCWGLCAYPTFEYECSHIALPSS
jgi:hypothetical protein